MIKTWQERSGHEILPVTMRKVQALMQAEIDELRAENARLKANLETRKSNYNRLKAMVDDGSISDRTFSLCEELEKENARLRDALRHLAETHAWLAFGECRAFGTGRRMLTSAEADKVARAALGKS